LHDFQTGSNTIVSVDQNGNPGTTGSFDPYLSPDGNKVAFYGTAVLVPGASGNGSEQVYFRNLSSTPPPTTTRVVSGLDSSGNRDAELNGQTGVWEFYPTSDLRYFAFNTPSTNVISNAPGGPFTDGYLHCFLIDTTTNTVIPLDVNPDGSEMAVNLAPNVPSHYPPGCQKATVTSDGNYALIVEQPLNSAHINNFIVTKTDQFTYTAVDTQGNFVTGTVTLTEPLMGNNRITSTQGLLK